jgi:hypothetical protein
VIPGFGPFPEAGPPDMKGYQPAFNQEKVMKINRELQMAILFALEEASPRSFIFSLKKNN